MNMLSVREHYPLKVIETAGRNVGWLTAASALSKRQEEDAPHLLLVAEHPFDEYLDADKCMITQAFYNYAVPLLGDPLPAYPKLKQIKVP